MHYRYFSSILFSLVAALCLFMSPSILQSEDQSPASIERITPQDARTRIQTGKAILVCAYDDKRCEGQMLEGALTRKEFEEKLPSLSKEQEIITYCS